VLGSNQRPPACKGSAICCHLPRCCPSLLLVQGVVIASPLFYWGLLPSTASKVLPASVRCLRCGQSVDFGARNDGGWCIAREEITVVYERGGSSLKVHVRLERDDIQMIKSARPRDDVAQDVDWIQLTEDDVRPPKFTSFLEDNARATDSLWVWCYRPVWLRLLKVLKVRNPPPATVRWPPEKAKHAR
jgi:hypothetical protein